MSEATFQEIYNSNSQKWKFIYYYPSGKKLCECIQIQSKAFPTIIEPSTLKYWYSNGNLRCQLNRVTDIIFQITSYYSNGNKFYEAKHLFPVPYFINTSSISFDVNNIKEDKFIYEDKNLPFEFSVEGKVLNEENKYYENGKIKTNITYYEEGKNIEANQEHETLISCCPEIMGIRHEKGKSFKRVIQFNEYGNLIDTTWSGYAGKWHEILIQ